MYSWEIEKYMKSKNYILADDEYFKLFDECPQINGIRYLSDENKFLMTTDDNYNFKFKVYKKEKNNGNNNIS